MEDTKIRTSAFSKLLIAGIFAAILISGQTAFASPVGLWKFDEGSGSIAYDSAGDNDGILVNGPTWTTGKMNNALAFDGLDDYVDLGNSSSLKPFLPVTVSAWIKLNSPETSHWWILTLGTPEPNYYGIWFFVTTGSNLLSVHYCDGEGTGPLHRRSKYGTTELETDRWYHVAAVLRGPTNMDLYIDAVDDGGTYSGEGGNLAYSSSNSYIGYLWSYNDTFKGVMDDVRVYNEALSAGEIEQLYQEGLSNIAFNPSPADGAITVEPNVILSWTPGKDAASHDVYFGTNYISVYDANKSSTEYRGNVDVNSWDPCSLNINTTYYWRIDEVNDPNLWKGSVWSFSTYVDSLRVPSEYPNIQAAIEAASDSNFIIVAPGTYKGAGNRDIDFLDKAITVKSENGPENCIIDCEGDANNPHRGFYFHGGETSSSVLDGFTITGGYVFACDLPYDGGAGICCIHSSPTINNCVITGNHTELIPGCLGFCYGGGIKIRGNASPTFKNCIISNNSIGACGTGGGVYDDAGATFLNCTISANSAIGPMSDCGGIACSHGTIINCIIWGNNNGQIGGYSPTVAFSNIEGGYTGTGNINVEPCFANPGNGDYHLKSEAGRWNPNSQSWVTDEVTSPCISKGNPGCPLGEEPNDVNNVRINMGAYGGTAETSKTPAGRWYTIADLTNTSVVSIYDLQVFASYWLDSGQCIPSDLDRSESVDFVDYAVFAQYWLYPPPPGEAGIEYEITPCDTGMSLTGQMDGTRFTVTVQGSYIYFEDMMVANCCPEILWLEMDVTGNLITINEHEELGEYACLCICDYPVTATLGPFGPGTYTIEVYEDWGGFIGSTIFTIE